MGYHVTNIAAYTIVPCTVYGDSGNTIQFTYQCIICTIVKSDSVTVH